MGRASQLHRDGVQGCINTTYTISEEYGIASFYRGTGQRREDYLSCNDASNGLGCIRNPSAAVTSGEQRRMLCVITRFYDAKNEIRSCSVHLINLSSNPSEILDGYTRAQWNAWQVADVAGQLSPKASSGTAIVVAGDFNADPSKMTTFNSQFQDVDYPEQTYTHSVASPSTKIDWVLVSDTNGRFYGISGLAANPTTCATSTLPNGSCSDHRIVRGSATLRSLP